MSLALQVDIDKNTVTVWELKLDAALAASSKAWYNDEAVAHAWYMEEVVLGTWETSRIEKHSWNHVRCDATNTAIWQKTKLHTCEVKSSRFHASDLHASSDLESFKFIEHHRRFKKIKT